ncbi:MAG: hypothetical protein FJ317_03050 [SAR202 cluster bacterium]|nr:hypothetical protein [SAR202 cluster bacterium]
MSAARSSAEARAALGDANEALQVEDFDGVEKGLQRAVAKIQSAFETAPDVGRYYIAASQVMDTFFGFPIPKDTYEILAAQVYELDVRAEQETGFAIYPRLRKVQSATRLQGLGDASKGDEVLRAYQELTEIIPDLWAFYLLLGSQYWQRGEYEQAHEATAKGLRLTEGSLESATLHYLQGLVYRDEGRLDEAIRSFENGLTWKASLPDEGRGLTEALEEVREELESR